MFNISKILLDVPPPRSCIIDARKRNGTIEAIYLSFPLCWGLCTLLNHIAFVRLYRKKSQAGSKTAM
ncbi:MAG: hypothetical protein SOZ90_03235 [Candidatus Faecousia sp.]|nr:hypothetical protein [Candidatus Faecousia sp.]